MRHLSKAIIHGLRLAQHQQQNPDRSSITGNRNLVISSILTSNVAKFVLRKLGDEDDFDFDALFGNDVVDSSTNPSGDDGFFGLGGIGDDFLLELEQCNIDVESIMLKVIQSPEIMADMSGMMEGNDASSMIPNSSNIQDMMSSDFNFFVNILADENEVACTSTEKDEFISSFESFNKCTGIEQLMTKFENPADVETFTNMITSKCSDVTNAVLDVDSGDYEFINDSECTDAVLGDNPVGNFIRGIYHHPDKWCNCYAELGDAVPTCLLQAKDMDYKNDMMMNMKNNMSDMMDELEISGSSIKKMTCLVGIGCKAIDDLCLTELQGLDKCLPEVNDMNDIDKSEKFCDVIYERCDAEGTFTVVPPPLTMLTESELPDSCERVASNNDQMSSIPERFSRFGAVCGGDNSSINNISEEETEVAAHASSATSEEEEGEGKEEIEVVAHSSTATSEEDAMKTNTTANNDKKSTSSFWAAGFVVAAVIAVVFAFVIRKKRSTADAHFDHVGSDDKDDELEVSSGLMA